MAARFGATIVPFSAIGADDSVEMLASREELLSTPVLGDLLKQRTDALPVPRAREEEGGQAMVAPIVVPKPLPRYYFLFGKPVSTASLPVSDREALKVQYEDIKRTVEDGMAYLLEKRKSDPFRDFLPRRLYELSWGEARQ